MAIIVSCDIARYIPSHFIVDFWDDVADARAWCIYTRAIALLPYLLRL